MIGSRLGPWLIDEEVGRGGMGAVYKAHRIEGEGPEEAAVKILAAELALEVGFRQRFEREISILRQLEHPHIVRFLESGEYKGRYFYAMEFINGPSYAEILEQSGALSWQAVLQVALQIAPALKHAHDRGVVHRDLKPANLLQQILDPANREQAFEVKLADFGIATLFASPHLTVTGGVIGTPEYLSPEQATGKPVTRRSGLYSLGVVLYTLLTGRTPFEGNPIDLLHKHRYAQFEKPSRLVSDLPPDLEALICQLLEKEPSDRPPDAGVLHRQLLRVSRKLERKAANAQEELHEASPDQPLVGGERVGPATLMSRLMRQTLDEEAHGGPGWRLLHHPLVLLGLFLVTLGSILWAIWPLGPEALFDRGALLMASDNPDDHARAWDRYLGPLEERFPDHPYHDEVESLRQRYQDEQSERSAARSAKRARPQSEAEWFFYQGLRLRQRGDEQAAAELWNRLILAFEDVPAENSWVRRARLELSKAPPGVEDAERQWRGLRAAMRRIDTLRQEDPKEADRAREALWDLYREDAAGRELLREAGLQGRDR